MKSNDYLKVLKDYHEPKKDSTNLEILTEQEKADISTLLAIFLFGSNTWMLWRAIKAKMDKANKKCGTFSTSATRDQCILKERIKECDKKIKMLNGRMKDCRKKRDPDDCRKAGRKLIKKYEDKKDIYEDKLKELEGKEK